MYACEWLEQLLNKDLILHGWFQTGLLAPEVAWGSRLEEGVDRAKQEEGVRGVEPILQEEQTSSGRTLQKPK